MWRYKRVPREQYAQYRIKKQNDPEPDASQSTFLFDIEMNLNIKMPRSTGRYDKRSDTVRAVLTVSVAKMMSQHTDWSLVGTILLNRLRKYINSEEKDWKFEIREKTGEYWNYKKQLHLARHCAPLRDTRQYPNMPIYDEINFVDIIGDQVELSFTMNLFLSPAIFGAHEKYEEREFQRTSPWYGNSTDEENFQEALKIFTSKRRKTELNRYKQAWEHAMDMIDVEAEDYHDHGY